MRRREKGKKKYIEERSGKEDVKRRERKIKREEMEKREDIFTNCY